MSVRARITSKGQVTIPSSVRRVLGVKQGDILVFEEKGASCFVVHREEQEPASSLEGMFQRYAKARPVTLKEMDDAIAQGAAQGTRRR